MSTTGHDGGAAAAPIQALVEPLVTGAGLDLYDVELTGGTVRVLVDRDGGVDLELLGAVTRAVSAALDEHDPLPGRYTLEVSSPGLERPLRTPAHFRRAVGDTVNLKVVAGAAASADRRLRGRLAEADDDGIVVEVDGEGRRLPYGEIERARTVFEWGPGPKPGAGGKAKGQKKQRKRAATP